MTCTGCAEAAALGLARYLEHARELSARRDELTAAAGRAAVEAREAARSKPPSELDGLILMTPAARDLLENAPEPHTAAGREAARRIAARRQRGIQ